MTVVDGIRVYTVGRIADLKADAFVRRTAGRDIFDLDFLTSHYAGDMSDDTLLKIAGTVLEHGVERLAAIMAEDDILRAHDPDLIAIRLEGNCGAAG